MSDPIGTTTASNDPAQVGTLVTETMCIDQGVALIEGLSSGTKCVEFEANSGGLAQIARYLQIHHDVGLFSLNSHDSVNAVQVGSTWLTYGIMADYQGQFVQIGAAIKTGDDSLIDGCNLAQQADSQAIVQK